MALEPLPITKMELDPDWWQNHDNLSRLCYWLAGNGYDASDIAYAVEKPWKFEDEYRDCVAEREEEGR